MEIFSIQIFGDSVEPVVVERMVQADARAARLAVQWQYIEPLDQSPPQYSFEGMYPPITSLTEAGIDVIAVLYGRPTWAATTGCGPIDRVPLGRYQAYLSTLVEHFDGDGVVDGPGSPTIKYWEVENEQDFNTAQSGGATDHGSCFGGPNAASYGAQLRAAYLAIKSADPEATVLFGGLAYDRFYNKQDYSPRGPFDYTFAKNTLSWLRANHGGEAQWPFFDWMAIHMYNDFRNNWDGPQPYRQELAAKLSHFKDHQLVQAGSYDLRNSPIAVTEASIPSSPSDEFTNRSEALQAAYPGQLLARAMAANLRTLTWFLAEDRFYGPCTSIYDWITVGLLRSLDVFDRARACGSDNPIPSYHVTEDHEPKPAFVAFMTAQAQLGGTIFVDTLPRSRTGSDQIEAYRVYHPGDGYRIVAFTDNGERLGHMRARPLTRSMVFGADILPFWTGRIEVTDHLGATSTHEGGTITLPIRQEPIYVRVR